MKTFNKSLKITFVDLVIKLAKDTGVSVEDTEYVIRRFKNEGLRFLTFTLPSLSKSVILSLECGEFIRPTDFAWKGKSLFFMNSFLSKIFSPTGKVRDDACPHSIANLRQFCEYFYKLALETSEEEKVAGEQKYVENELHNKQFKADVSWMELLRVNLENNYPSFCRTPVSQVFEHHRPRVGPGSFGSPKNQNVNSTLYKVLPSYEVGTVHTDFSAFSGYFKSYPSSPEYIYPVSEDKISVVTFVAKDARGPRVISMEPLHLLRAQMSFLDWSIKTLQRETEGRIQFVDQTQNNQHAKSASLDRTKATLDLKDASDRVSYHLMSYVFQNTFAPRFFLQNARSTHTLLPSGAVIPLHKVAGMGSGLTFPTMALLIHLSICSLVSERFSLPYDFVARSVYVYGDDVVVPTCWYNVAITALSRSGLQVNLQKSFYRGFFRESCGGDYYKGISNTPVKLRLDKVDLKSASIYKRFLMIENNRALFKLNQHAKECTKHNLVHTAAYYNELIHRTLRFYPQITGSSPLIGEYVNDLIVKDTISVQAFTLEPIKEKTTRHCPYKYISEALNPRVNFTSTFKDALKAMIQQTGLLHGEYVQPRNCKLTLRRHSGMKTF